MVTAARASACESLIPAFLVPIFGPPFGSLIGIWLIAYNQRTSLFMSSNDAHSAKVDMVRHLTLSGVRVQAPIYNGIVLNYEI